MSPYPRNLPLLILPILLTLACNPVSAQQTPSLRISGAEGALLENLKAALPLSGEDCQAPKWRIRRLFRQSDQALIDAARALGHYHIGIDKRLGFDNDCWQAEYRIEPGEPLRITAVDVQIRGDAADDPQFKRLLAQSPVQSGAILHHGHYESLKRDLEIIAAERGYFDARFTRKALEVDPGRGESRVILHFHSGERYRVKEVRLHQDAYATRLLERYISFKTGDPYETGRLTTLQRSLSDSGLFDGVSVRPDLQGKADGQIAIDVHLTPRKRVAYLLGAGVSTDTGPRVIAGYERRRINRMGHRFESKLTLSPVDSSLTAEYTIPLIRPGFYPQARQLVIGAGYRHQETDSATTSTQTLGASILAERGGWREITALDWVTERYTIGDQTTEGQLLTPSIAWSRTRTDDPIRTRNGYRMNIELRGSHAGLLSDVSFVQSTLDGKWIRPLAAGRLLLRGELGATLIDAFDKLPPSYRYYAGGDQSVRGYGYRSLGPADSEGEVVGGKYLFSASLEYEYPLNDRWGLALFADTGNAVDDWQDGLKSAVGPGLRWHSPVGPIRLDLAFPLDNPDEDFRIHFSMGPDL